MTTPSPQPLTRRQILRSAATATAAAAASHSLWAETAAPLDSVKMVCGFPAGSTSDVTARSIADRLPREGYARSAFVDNKTGAGAQIAVQYLKTQTPDGRTLLQTPMSMLGIYPHTYKKLPYDPVADLAPVSLACTFDFALAVGPAVPERIRTLAQLMEWFKADSSRASFGSPAAGATPHFIGMLLARSHGIEMTHVAYRGTALALQDVVGGQLPAAIGPVGDVVRFRQSKGYRILATTGETRSRFAPEVPSLNELGLRDFVFQEWYGIFLPANPSSRVLQRAASAVRTVVAMPETVRDFATAGLEAKSSSPQELVELLRQDTERWGRIVRSIGFTVEA